jgi:hypothetical protein
MSVTIVAVFGLALCKMQIHDDPARSSRKPRKI